jgi:predicted deacylase
MAKVLTVGTATAQAGTIQYGRWEALGHPTGHSEFLPVILAQGRKEGPCLWLTAGIHGPEQAGPAVLYRLITQALVDKLRGMIVAIPALNPAGLRTSQRKPYHVDKDPNRLWPDGKPKKPPDPDREPPSSLEQAYARLYDEIVASADMLIDFHNAWIASIPFSLQDRVLYRDDAGTAEHESEARKAQAEALSERDVTGLWPHGHPRVPRRKVHRRGAAPLHLGRSAAPGPNPGLHRGTG